MTSLRTSALGVAPLLLVLSCSGGAPGDDDGTVLTRDEIEEAYADTVCTQATTCEDEYGPLFPDRASCDASFELLIENVGAFLDPDLFDFDGEAAQRCLDAIASGCQLPLTDPPAECEEIFAGKLGEDDCCDERGGCRDGMYCLTPVGETMGTCQPYVARSGDCSGGRQCGAEDYCNASDACEQRVAENGVCSNAEPCAEGLYCAPPPTRTCRPLRADGDGCGQDFECASGQCVDNECVGDLFAGDACVTDDDQCSLATRCIATGAGTEGTCQPLAKEGQACSDTGTSDPPCAEYGLLCDATPHRCETAPTAGQDCTTAGTCYPPWEVYCHDIGGGSSSCLARIDAGEPCFPGEDNGGCAYGLRGDADTSECVPSTTPEGPICL